MTIIPAAATVSTWSDAVRGSCFYIFQTYRQCKVFKADL